MGLDIVLFRADKGGNPDMIRLSQQRRGKPVETVQEIIDLDKTVRDAKYKLDLANGEYTNLNKQVAKLKKEGKTGEEVDALVQQATTLDANIKKLKTDVVEYETLLVKKLKPIGNIVHESVPVSNNEDDNLIERQWGECNTSPDLLHHHELLDLIDGYDIVRGTNVSGHRCYFLKGVGVELNQAIINYALNFLKKDGFTQLQTPFFMKKEIMSETAQLEQFDEELYKVIEDEETEKYLIATSEQPISAYHRGEWLEEKDLPRKYAGFSTCFRKEAGSHGRDTWGIFRVHQFEKIEQFVITKPEDSWEMFDKMIGNAEAFYQSLGLPYRVVSIVSGALNNAAAKKFDLEGWFPGYNEYRELVSCSNCTDYQARDLEIRCGMKKQGQAQKKYVHMLNSTLAATTRVICCILENYQTEGGINVPKPLQPYMGGTEFIPFDENKVKERLKATKKTAAKTPAAAAAPAAAAPATTN
eukprot:gene213-259_t